MAKHVHWAERPASLLLLEPGLQRRSGLAIAGVQFRQALPQLDHAIGIQPLRGQGELLRQQHPRRIRRIEGFLLHSAGDQGAVVMER